MVELIFTHCLKQLTLLQRVQKSLATVAKTNDVAVKTARLAMKYYSDPNLNSPFQSGRNSRFLIILAPEFEC